MGCLALSLALLASPADQPAGLANPSSPVRSPAPPRGKPGAWGWLADPRSAVLLTLGGVLLFGGGLRVLRQMQARRASARLAAPDVSVEEIAEAARHGREGLIDLFRLLATAPEPARRDAAGRAIAALWKQDNLIAEEEKALVRRGYSVDWKTRRRFPRDLDVPVPIRVEYGVPFLRDQSGEVGPGDLAWSHRVAGTERASLEEPSPFAKGPPRAEFLINPADFAGPGPHKLVFKATVRTDGLTDPWELDLPHVPFQFDLDPNLKVDALLTLPDQARADAIAAAVSLRPVESGGDASRFVPLTADLVLRDPPGLVVTTPLPCDLSHRIGLEFEGIPGIYRAGTAIVSGQGAGGPAGEQTIPIVLEEALPPGSIERPGEIRVRAVLTADPHRGWADPDVRSIWPGSITTEWASARVARR